jgi:GH25 family lysozyme M1 (1,4-beta-N-acetylmuramidase)
VVKTCSEVGYTHYACDNCEYAFDSDFIPQSHSFETSVTRPTATQTGFTTHTCKDCAYYYDSDFLKYTDILPSPYLDDSTPLCKGIDIANIERNTKPDGSYEAIDWESLKAQGYDFVILKVGSNYSGKSNTFEMDYAGAKAAGLGVGAYYYAYSSTVSGTRKDAQEVLEWIEGKQFEYPIYYDIEESYLAESLSKDSLTELITTFIEELQANGYYSALYVNANWLNNILDTETIISRFDIWYARFVPEESPTWDESFGKQLSMWQYTDKGIAEGIRDYIDINYCYRDYPTLMKKWGLNGFEKEIEEIEETKETAKAEEVSEEK